MRTKNNLRTLFIRLALFVTVCMLGSAALSCSKNDPQIDPDPPTPGPPPNPTNPDSIVKPILVDTFKNYGTLDIRYTTENLYEMNAFVWNPNAEKNFLFVTGESTNFEITFICPYKYTTEGQPIPWEGEVLFAVFNDAGTLLEVIDALSIGNYNNKPAERRVYQGLYGNFIYCFNINSSVNFNSTTCYTFI